MLLVFLINLTPVQNFLANKATQFLSDKLKTKVTVKHVRIDFLNHVLLQGLYVEDHAHDTLLYAGEAQVRITDWFFLKKEVPTLSYIGLHDAKVHLYRTKQSKEWNYQFIIDAFDSGPKKKKQQKNNFQIDLKTVDLQRVRFHMDDAWSGEDMDFDVGKLAVDADKIDLKKNVANIAAIKLSDFSMWYNDYVGGKPIDSTRKKKKNVIDTTAFNTDNWAIAVKKLQLDNCAFYFKSDEDVPAVNEFDPAHMNITGIDIDVQNLRIQKDTIHAKLNHLAAKERCGIEIKDFRSVVTVSPNASICDSLYLETNHSKLKNYYAMHYKRFPDFTDYINKVIMVGKLKDAIVDARDVAYFAPTLRTLYPATLKVNGSAVGTVADIDAKNLDVNDGVNTVKGDLAMKGLPDINTTFIDFKNGEIMTSGPAIMRYAPSLKNNPNLALEKVQYAYFKGSFTGYLESFATNGTLTTNLGTLASDVKYSLPNRRGAGATYAGKITGTNINLGVLLRQPDLGSTTFTATVNGNDFDPHKARININTLFQHLYFHGYDYQNITAEGVLAQRHFDGKLLVDDPNLALAFNGNIDFSQKLPEINATANLLKSNLKALKLTKDSVLATADFDLNCTGNNIDNFLGFAKLYNINLIRNNNRLDVDSVTLLSAESADGKMLALASNDITARVSGQYQLSKILPSLQFYLSNYLPAYIQAPQKAAPNQIINFDITTRNIENLLTVVAPNISGFSNASIKGSINTTSQELTLNATAPYGAISNVRMVNISLQGNGNYNELSLKGNIGNLMLKDSILDMSVNANTTLGNDSLRFNIVTSSPLSYGTATINGHAFARGDSLYVNILPSEFYLNQNKWEINEGNRIVFSKNYLDISNLVLHSDLQQIQITTARENEKQTITADMKNLDLAALSSVAGFSAYQPDGRLNGTFSIRDIFTDMYASADLTAMGVKLSGDTIGNIKIIGNYDGTKKLITLTNESGVFNGNSSLIATGTLSFDSTSHQAINGKIQFNNATLTWLSPVLAGLVSQLDGHANGTILIKGTAAVPDISGTVKLDSAKLRVDYLGTNYTIPSGTITIDNESISAGKLSLYDRFNNEAIVTGSVAHNHLKDFNTRLQITSPSFEVLNLQDYENKNFYGNIIANIKSLSIRGPFEDITLNINASPSKASHLYIPISSGGDISSYSYVSFKSYGENQQSVKRKKANRFKIGITAVVTPDLEMTMILDPSTGDEINAKGNGSINMSIASNSDFNITGKYEIDQGDYTFTFRQLFFKRKFIINSGSTISFNGPMSKIDLNVNASYRTIARLYDLLNDQEKQSQMIPSSELADAKTAQNVDVILHMKGSLQKPELTFNLELPEKRSVGTYAYTKLERINTNDRELFDQVASLLLVGTFIPPEGLVGTTAKTGAINNMSEIISTTASSQLTNIVNKLLGDKSLNIELKYKNYNLSDPTIEGGINRNELRFGIRQSLFKERVVVEIGSYYDWGRPTTNNTTASSALTLAGDFRVQYLVTEDGRFRLNGFRTSNFDVAVGQNVSRAGIGISWRKTFDNLQEFFHGVKYTQQKQQELNRSLLNSDSTSAKKADGGTW